MRLIQVYIYTYFSNISAANVQKKVEGFGGMKWTLAATILPVVLGVILFIACSCYFQGKRNKMKGKVYMAPFPHQFHKPERARAESRAQC